MVEHARQLQRFGLPDAVGDQKGPCLGIAHLPLQHQTHGFPGFLTTQARAGAPARGSWDGSGAAAFATGAGGPWPHWRSDSRRIADLGRGLAATPGSPSAAQALTAPEPEVAPAFWLAAREAGGFSLVPLLLLPGGHVRIDVPALAAIWRAAARAPGAGPIPLRRFPFLGAWPAWQRLLAAELTRRAGGLPWHWLHHPLEGPLARRYLDYLAAVLGGQGLAAPYTGHLDDQGLWIQGASLVVPLTLAANRLTESLALATASQGLMVLPPLLELPSVRQFLIASLEALP